MGTSEGKLAGIGIVQLFFWLFAVPAYGQSPFPLTGREKLVTAQECCGHQQSVGRPTFLKSLNRLVTPSQSTSARDSTSRLQRKSQAQVGLNPNLPPGQFLSATRIDSDGETIHQAVSGDFNGDKLPDAITVVRSSESPTSFYLSVLLSRGDGAFSSPILTPVQFGQNNHYVLVADLNKDGKDDVILVHPSSIDILVSSGDDTFAASTSLPTGISWPIAARLWDVNRDNVLDVVVVDGLSNQAVALAGSGHGGFGAPQLTFFPDQVSAGILADIDLDGNLDLITNTNLYPGDGNEGFLAAIPLQSDDGQSAGAVFSGSVAVADVNGDGRPDVVTANGFWNTVTIFLNQGGRSLVQSGVSVWAGNDPMAVAIGDIDGDGAQDLIVTNFMQSDLAALLGKGDGTFSPAAAGYAIGGAPNTKAVLADFDSDGSLDLLVSDNQSSVVLALGGGDGTFHAAVDAAAVVPPGTSNFGGAISIASADFNGDGIPDFVVGQSSISPGLGMVVFLTKHDGSLGPGVVHAPNHAISYVAVGDINQDGKIDIVASDGGTGSLDLFLGNGDGTFQPRISISLPDYTNDLVVADLNDDGWPDVALAGIDPQAIILLNDGQGALVPSGTYPLSGTAYELAAADVNNDSKLDLLIPMTSSSRVAVLLNRGDGSFSAAADYETTLATLWGIAVGDLNKDGKPDLVITSLGSGDVVVALGNGDGSFNTPAIFPASSQFSLSTFPAQVKLADLNGDGNLDAVYANSNLSTLGLLLGGGDGNLYGPFEFPSGNEPFAVIIADLNHDGWPDVVTADAGFSGITVFYNTSGPQALPDYTLSSNPTSVSVANGGTASATISLFSINSFHDSVQLSCLNLPAELSCDFSPSVLHLAKGASASSKLSIAAAQVAAAQSDSSSVAMALAIVPAFGTIFLFAVFKTPKIMMLLTLFASLMVFSGCHSLARTKQAKNYTIVVQGVTAKGKSHSVQVQVTVQP